ncbi:MAG: hypothetical protein NC177_17065 [Ruminococcus flavefaciens]|nr:hypothetical protein [Ruminococcus flavefaciens]
MSDIFSDFIQEIEKNNLNLHGIEIFKDSDIIFRHMWNDDIRYPIYSATKSFTSTPHITMLTEVTDILFQYQI